MLLPERFCAIGYSAGRREVFRVWGSTIPDELVLSPDWLATDNPEALLGGDRAWMVDFDAAVAKGMAIEVTQAQIEAPPPQFAGRPFDLASGTLERLVVVGFEWTKTAADSAADFTDLLAAHRDSGGLGFAALGTPTNNTEAASAGYSPSVEKLPPPATPGNGPEDQDALQLLTWALGIDPKALPPDNIDNAHLTDQRTALHMMNVLWRGIFGDYLLEMWNPYVGNHQALDSARLYALRRYAASYVRPTGALPILRANKQPYGVLPLAGKRFAGGADSAVETAIGKVLGVLRPMWELASADVPRLIDGDVDKAKQILQTAAWSQTAFYRDKDSKNVCLEPTPFSDAQRSARDQLVQNVMAALGPLQPLGRTHRQLQRLPARPAVFTPAIWPACRGCWRTTRTRARRRATRRISRPPTTTSPRSPRRRSSRPPLARPYSTPTRPGRRCCRRLRPTRCRRNRATLSDRFVGTSNAVNRVLSPRNADDALRRGRGRERSDVHGADTEGVGQRLDTRRSPAAPRSANTWPPRSRPRCRRPARPSRGRPPTSCSTPSTRSFRKRAISAQ